MTLEITHRLFTALYFLIFFLIVEPTDRIARELDASAKGRLEWVGVRIEINSGAVDIFGKKLIPPFSETENSDWLKGDKNVITLTTVDRDCV